MTESARARILAANEAAARALRRRFEAEGTLVVNLISSPGSGKTTLLEVTARRLQGLRLQAVVGDIATERDADRLRAAGLPAHQIVTGGACHLDARMLDQALQAGAVPHGLDLLLVENVGNLVCPASYDLGEAFKVVLLSVTEGDDKPFKYPGIFSRAAVTLVTKWDLLPHVPFDFGLVREQVLALNPEARIFPVSARTGEGLDTWCELLQAVRRPRPAGTAGGSGAD